MKTGKDETTLIAELKQDSQQALRGIYERYAGRLYAFGLQYCKSRECVEELVEDTFVWLWTHRRSIRQSNSLRAVLFIRMRHFLINAYRTTVNSVEFEDYLNYKGRLTDGDTDWLEYDDFVRMVHDAIARLPETQRRVVQLSRMERLSNHDIAHRLNLKEQTVKNQLSLGLKALKQMLGPAYGLYSLLFFVN